MRHFLFGADLWRSRFGTVVVFTVLTQLYFLLDWCLCTTFRSLSMLPTWPANLFLALCVAVPFVLTRKVWVQLSAQLLVDLIYVANLMYYRTYFSGIPPESYLLMGNLTDFMSSVWDSLRWVDLGFAIILIAEGLVLYRIRRDKVVRLGLRYLAWVGLTGAVFGLVLLSRGGLVKACDQLVESCHTGSCTVSAYTVPGHVAYYLLRTSQDMGPEVGGEIDGWLADRKAASVSVELPDSVSPPRNLVVILLESFETWLIGTQINGKPVTPYIDSLISLPSTLYVPRMLTQVDGGRSIDAQLLITTGLLPAKGTVYCNRFTDNTYPSLCKALKRRYGSHTALFTTDNLITWNLGKVASLFGYDKVYDRTNWVKDETIGSGKGHLSDGSFFRQLASRMDELIPEGEPMMMTILSYSGHNPFRLPDGLRDPEFDVRPAGLHQRLTDYITMAHYTDSQLPTLLEALQSRADYAETLVVITGDHEGLAQERREIRGSSAEAAAMVDAGQFTPFIVLNSPVAGRYDEVIGQVDMYPTLLDLLGLDNYFWRGLGQSVFEKDRIPAAISSMTNELAGDTTGIEKARLEHRAQSRDISDKILRSDYFSDKDVNP